MRKFSYFLYENFDPDLEKENLYNPRRILGKQTDMVLSYVAGIPAFSCSYFLCRQRFGESILLQLIEAGALRREEDVLLFDSPVFLREDASVLYSQVRARAFELAAMLEKNLPRLQSLCRQIQNGTSVEENMYHILCGMIFDGSFFDYLNQNKALATSRRHCSGLDYLAVIYEDCAELRSLSNGLLCSYNRLANNICSLQSFGDAQGSRFDFYRVFRQLEHGDTSPELLEAKRLLDYSVGGLRLNKNSLLRETAIFCQTGRCQPAVLELLELFGYAENGKICVPVYMAEHRKTIEEMKAVVEESIGRAVGDILMDMGQHLNITAVSHGVPFTEIANELYHILFGSVNEELMVRGIVSSPLLRQGEGRYLKCIEIY